MDEFQSCSQEHNLNLLQQRLQLLYIAQEDNIILLQAHQKKLMKRLSAFYLAKKKKVKQLVDDLNEAQVSRQKSIVDQIIKERKKKIRELSLFKSKELNQNPFKHINKQYSEFIRIQPHSKDQPYLEQKNRRKITMTDRVYSSQPNMKVGLDISPRNHSVEVQDKEVMNRKFMEYEKLINQQSAIKKIQRLSRMKITKISFPKSTNRSNRMKKTYFQKFIPDKYNFYDPSSVSYESIKLGYLSKRQNERTLQSSGIGVNLSKLKKINSTVQTRPTITLQLETSIMNQKNEKTRTLQSSRQQTMQSRRKLFTKIKLQSIVPKNLDTLQY